VSRIQVWTVLLALTCFGAGLAAGRILSISEPPQDGVLADHEALLTERFELSPERQRHLKTLLQNYQLEIDRIKDRHLAEYMAAAESDLEVVGNKYNDLLRNRVLPASKRSEYTQLLSAGPSPDSLKR